MVTVLFDAPVTTAPFTIIDSMVQCHSLCLDTELVCASNGSQLVLAYIVQNPSTGTSFIRLVFIDARLSLSSFDSPLIEIVGLGTREHSLNILGLATLEVVDHYVYFIYENGNTVVGIFDAWKETWNTTNFGLNNVFGAVINDVTGFGTKMQIFSTQTE